MTPIPDFPLFASMWNEHQRLRTPHLHFDIATWLSERWHAKDRRLLLLAFRNSGKSTLVGLFAAWRLASDPNTRILVLAADHSLARKMVRNVKRVIERHPVTCHLKPRRADQWAADQFTIVRARESRDPSMLARGIGANMTGSRADIVICDDVEVPNTSDTAAKRTDLRERLHEVDYVLVPGGTQLYVGTPHSYYSIYADAARPEIQEDAPFLAGFSRLELPIVNDAGASRWPERFPASRIAAVRDRTGPAKFNSQMLLVPTNVAEGRLDTDAMKHFDDDLRYVEANGEARLFIGTKRLVSASGWWDPAFGAPGGGDASVVAALFTDEDGHLWLNDVAYIEHDPAKTDDIDAATQLCRQVASVAKRNYLPAITVETNGLGRFLPGLLRRETRRAGLLTAVIETSARRSKDLRIVDAFDAVLAAGRLHAHARVWASPFITEMREWRPGDGGRDDGLDAVAGCLAAEPVRLPHQPLPTGVEITSRTNWRRGANGVIADSDFRV